MLYNDAEFWHTPQTKSNAKSLALATVKHLGIWVLETSVLE